MPPYRRKSSGTTDSGDGRDFFDFDQDVSSTGETTRFDSGSQPTGDLSDSGQFVSRKTARLNETMSQQPRRVTKRQAKREQLAETVVQETPAPETNPTRYTRAYDESYSATGSGQLTSPSGQYSSTSTGNITGSHERVISQMHRHAARLFLPALILIAVPAVVAYLYGTFDLEWQNILILVAGLIAIVLFCMLPLLFWLSTNYTITTRRIVIRRGLLTQIRQELLHSRSYDITVRRGLLQRMFGSGDIEINAGLERPIMLKNVPDVVLVQQVLQELMERSASSIASRRQRGEAQNRYR